DEADRWYPLPGYSGFRKAGVAIGKDGAHTASGVWSIAPPAKQYSEVTLGTVARGGGGPVVRIDRTNNGQTGWLLFLAAENLSLSGIYKMNPDGSFTGVRLFTPAIVSGDKWRLTADGNTLEVFRNGVSQFTYTTDGSYATGDVGIEAYTPAFAFMGWEGGDTAAVTPAPTITSFTPTSGPVGTPVTITGTNFTGASAVRFNGTSANFTATSSTSISATVPSGATTGPLSVTTPGGTATSASSFTVAVQRFTLTVSKTGLIASGTVTSSPAGINCGATCSATYTSGTVVTLTATPGFLSVFIGWSGCDADSGTTCTVTMSAAREVTANFLP